MRKISLVYYSYINEGVGDLSHGLGRSSQGTERRTSIGDKRYHRWLELAYKANGMTYKKPDEDTDDTQQDSTQPTLHGNESEGD